MLIERIGRFAAQNPDRVALTFNQQGYPYAALWEAAARLRGGLAARGLVKGDRVAILLPNCPHFVIAHLAVLGLGCVSVPIHVQHKAREIGWQIEDSEARAVIGWGNLAAEAEKAATRAESVVLRLYLGDEIPEGAENLVEMIARSEPLSTDDTIVDAELAAILYTAGTGGHPRGVELTHGNFDVHAQELGSVLRIHEEDRILSALPFSIPAGLTGVVHLCFSHGAQLAVHSRFHPGDTLRSLQDDQITVLVGGPCTYALMAGFPSADKYDLAKLRYALCCESKLSEQTARDVEEKLKIRIFECYGATETCGIVTVNLFPGLVPRGSVGQPIGRHEVAVFDDAFKPAPAETTGQIGVRGPAVARGYRNRPDRTRQAIQEGWFLTGDRGCVDAANNLFVVGHSQEVVVKGGFSVPCREIEDVVGGLPHVQDVAVVGIPDPVLGEDLKACVVLKEGASIGPREIIEYVKERVALYKCPKVVKLYKELPRTASGKIIRNQLREDRA
jgi:long-chain acyl-CoA synthetase